MAMHSASSKRSASEEIFERVTGGSSSFAPTLGELLQAQHVPHADGVICGDSILWPSLSSHVIELHEDKPKGLRPGELPLGRPAPFVLAFTDLTYYVGTSRNLGCRRRGRCPTTNPVTAFAERQSVDVADGRKRALLNSISGEVREGEILAVMGASGSGKSTLIDALANRIAKESLKGSVTLNGEVLESSLLKVISAYVMQDDLLFPMLTVEETLTYAAEFRLPRTLSADKKRARVLALIDQLGLRAAAKTIIGDEGHRGVSGGERRRVSIGTDIIHDPILLLLDEPTSGLDSTSAFMVVKVLQRIARSGSIVIMSIHQPSYRIIGLLDRVMFLSKGQTVYSGPPNDLPAFFAGFGQPIANENWTELALDVIRDLEGSPTGTRSLVEFCISWQRRHPSVVGSVAASAISLKDAIAASIARGKLVSGADDSNNSGSASTLVPSYSNPLGVEVVILMRRAFTNTLRMPELFLTRLGTVLVTGFILATIFWQLDDSPKGLRERLAFFAFACSTTFYTCADALPIFVQERYIFMRETAYNAYRRSSYVLANAVVSFPPLIFLSVAFAATTFFAVGLNGGAPAFFFYVLIMLASFWAGSGFVTFLSGVISHVIMGYTIVVAALAYFSLFCGFFINRDRIPVYWLWFHYISLVKYPYEAVMHNEFGRSADQCFTRGVQIFDNTYLAGATEATKLRVLQAISGTLRANLTSISCMTRGSDVLTDNAVTQLGKWDNLLVTVVWGFIYRALFYFALQLGSRNKRR